MIGHAIIERVLGMILKKEMLRLITKNIFNFQFALYRCAHYSIRTNVCFFVCNLQQFAHNTHTSVRTHIIIHIVVMRRVSRFGERCRTEHGQRHGEQNTSLMHHHFARLLLFLRGTREQQIKLHCEGFSKHTRLHGFKDTNGLYEDTALILILY